MEAFFNHYLLVLLGIFAILLFVCLIRSIKGPRIADRIVSVNMIGTMVVVMISIASAMLHEDYLMDICLIYAMMSFLAVVVISKMYLGIYRQKTGKAADTELDGIVDGPTDIAAKKESVSEMSGEVK
ncbi:MAG: monovalent cation/H+ antiporter complex subunit F [Lachnospiraceae bacterium]|nr:monovalent cation/H+ antiporter complex subunit F [Clostridiales bacterium]MDY3109359.1 monovalent cation/H+ antiporter complex subunit F [Lachnospiraceae bacterium]